MSDATLAEICAVACAEAWRGSGEVLASPIGTIPTIGARLAALTFEPDLAYGDGEPGAGRVRVPVEGGDGAGGSACFGSACVAVGAADGVDGDRDVADGVDGPGTVHGEDGAVGEIGRAHV